MKKLITIFLGLGLMAGGIWLIGMEESTEPTGLKHMPAEIISNMIDQQPSLQDKFALIKRLKLTNKRLHQIAQYYENTYLKKYSDIAKMLSQYDDPVFRLVFGMNNSKEIVLANPMKYIEQALQKSPEEIRQRVFNAIKNHSNPSGVPELIFALYNPNPNMKSSDGRPLLSLVYNSPEMTKFLLDAGADPNLTFSFGDNQYTPLSWALIQDPGFHPKTVKYLLDAGADPNVTDKYGQTPLMFASMRGLTVTVRLLLDNKDNPANPLIKNNEKNTAKGDADNDKIKAMLQEAEDKWRAKMEEEGPSKE